jgi:hypothetical protein
MEPFIVLAVGGILSSCFFVTEILVGLRVIKQKGSYTIHRLLALFIVLLALVHCYSALVHHAHPYIIAGGCVIIAVIIVECFMGLQVIKASIRLHKNMSFVTLGLTMIHAISSIIITL